VILFPAIDLKEGLAVRLEQGDMTRATIFHRDPAAQARAFEQHRARCRSRCLCRDGQKGNSCKEQCARQACHHSLRECTKITETTKKRRIRVSS